MQGDDSAGLKCNNYRFLIKLIDKAADSSIGMRISWMRSVPAVMEDDMSLDRCKKCPYYMMHYKNEVLCNYMFEVRQRTIGTSSCVMSCPVE